MQTDIHSHILCGIDDGAHKPEVTRSALAALSREGVTHLALTPHYYPSRKPMHRFLARREDSYRALLKMPEAKQFHLSLGAEVYFTEPLFNYDDLKPLCYTGTNLMLTELEYGDLYTSSTRRRLTRLVEDYGITPVLAHIDRYSFLTRDPEILLELRDVGCLFQTNLVSWSKFFLRGRLARLARMGLVDFFGEDVHGEVICGKDRKDLLCRIRQKAPDLIPLANERAKKKIFLT